MTCAGTTRVADETVVAAAAGAAAGAIVEIADDAVALGTSLSAGRTGRQAV